MMDLLKMIFGVRPRRFRSNRRSQLSLIEGIIALVASNLILLTAFDAIAHAVSGLDLWMKGALDK